jgi:hypothetical protein
MKRKRKKNKRKHKIHKNKTQNTKYPKTTKQWNNFKTSSKKQNKDPNKT